MTSDETEKEQGESPGMLITFEGIEGSGKTTQMDLAQKELTRNGYQVFCAREPGGTPIGERVRSVFLSVESADMAPVAELMLMEACRAQLVKERILPEMEKGSVVLCDRFTDATLAYQGFGRGLDQQLIHTLNRIATHGIEPDLTFLLDCPVEMGFRRIHDRYRNEEQQRGPGGPDRLEEEGVVFHEKVRNGYRVLAGEHRGRIRLVDVTGGIETVHQRIMASIVQAIETRGSTCLLKKS